MSTPKKTLAKWTDEERKVIAEHQVTEKTLLTEDFRKLQAKLPGRDVQQISDQYRRIVKPGIVALFQSGSSSSAFSTPSKKRSRKEGSEECLKSEDTSD